MSTESTEKSSAAAAGGELKKRAAAGAVALFTSASMLVGGLFTSPADLPDGGDLLPAAICSEDEGDEDLSGGGDGGGKAAAGARERAEERAPGEKPLTDEERMGIRARLRRWLSARPLGLRLLAVLPIWVISLGLASLLSAFLPALMSPLLAKLLAWVLLALAMLTAFALSAKTLFPELPLKKILTKRSVSGLLLGAALLGAADLLLPLFWDGYGRFEAALRAGGVLLLTAAATLRFVLRRRKTEAPEPESATEAEPPEEPALSRRDILAMVDSVGKNAGKKKYTDTEGKNESIDN